MPSKRPGLLVATAIACLLLATLTPAANADYLTSWSGSVPVLGVVVNQYPGLVAGESCVAQYSVVYCVGGLNGTGQPTNLTYAAQVTGLGVGPWGRLADYPTKIAGESCVADAGYIYCIGGFASEATSNSTADVTPASYFAPLSGAGIGNWTRTTDYPFSVFDQSCVASSGFVYCVGGVTSNSTATPDVEYAQLSQSGIGQWNSGVPYPSSVSAGSCASYANYLYCVGGLNGASRATSSVYYAALDAENPGWIAGQSYPYPVAGHSCIIHYPGLYCIGGLNATAYATRGVFFSYLNGTGLNWIASIFYPVDVQSQSCVTDSSYIYCVGGYDGQELLASVYFSTIGTAQPTYTQEVATSSTTVQGAANGGASGLTTYVSLLVAVLVASIIVVSSLLSNRRLSQPDNSKTNRAPDASG